jgi:ribosomal protein S18 acetylase RimI-like enzyme
MNDFESYRPHDESCDAGSAIVACFRMSLIIRRATPLDHDDLAQIYLAARHAHFHWEDPRSFELSDFAQDSNGEVVFLACDTAGNVLGFISVWEPDSFIHLLFIAPGYERRGIGSRLLEHVENFMPYPHQLKCVEANLLARAFYRHLNWSEQERGHDGRVDYLLLEKTAPSSMT